MPQSTFLLKLRLEAFRLRVPLPHVPSTAWALVQASLPGGDSGHQVQEGNASLSWSVTGRLSPSDTGRHVLGEGLGRQTPALRARRPAPAAHAGSSQQQESADLSTLPSFLARTPRKLEGRPCLRVQDPTSEP